MSGNRAASIRAKLLNRAKDEKVEFGAWLNRFGRECLLYRIGISEYHRQFVLKGGMLFALWYNMPHRPTQDMDLLGFGPADLCVLERVFNEIARVEVNVNDGLRFKSAAQAEEIRKKANYGGVRIKLLAFLENARIPLQIDIGFGDPITPPEPQLEDYPVLLSDLPAPRLGTYPVYTVIAEKLHAITTIGMTNTCMKDFFDLYVILEREEIDDNILDEALRQTFEARSSALPERAPKGLSAEFAENFQKQKEWRAFLRKNEVEENLPLSDVLNQIRERFLPLLVVGS